jgi:hypothetical protein
VDQRPPAALVGPTRTWPKVHLASGIRVLYSEGREVIGSDEEFLSLPPL